MRFIQTIIAFFSLYLFVFAIFLLILLASWFSTYTANVPRQQIAIIDIEPLGSAAPTVSYKDVQNVHALGTILSRGEPQSVVTEKAVLSARSVAVFATFRKVTLSESLAPLGFTAMYHLEEVVDAKNTVVYKRNPSMLDSLMFSTASSLFTQSEETITLLATQKKQSYTVVVSQDGLVLQ